MKMRSIFGLVLAVTAASGCSTVTIPFAAENSGCPHVEYHPLCDADVHAAFSELKPSDKVLDVDSFGRAYDNDEDVVIDYTPDVVAPHTVLTKRIVCQQARGARKFWCRDMIRYQAYFYSKPEYYLAKGSGVSATDAMTVVRLMETGKITSDSGIWQGITKPENVYSLSLRSRLGQLSLYMLASGCSGSVDVEVQGSGDAQVLKIGDNEINCY